MESNYAHACAVLGNQGLRISIWVYVYELECIAQGKLKCQRETPFPPSLVSPHNVLQLVTEVAIDMYLLGLFLLIF